MLIIDTTDTTVIAHKTATCELLFEVQNRLAGGVQIDIGKHLNYSIRVDKFPGDQPERMTIVDTDTGMEYVAYVADNSVAYVCVSGYLGA